MNNSFDLSDVFIFETPKHQDNRGQFSEIFHYERFAKKIGREINFVQDNLSISKRGVVRGLHYQKYPHAQGKLVRVLRGEIFDVAVDIRKSSKTFGKWVGKFLSDNPMEQMWIPEGFAHGFLSMTDDVIVEYKVTNYYKKDAQCVIKWDDEELNIRWPKIGSVILSDNDQNGIAFKELVDTL